MPPLILLLETSTLRSTAALKCGDGRIVTSDVDPALRHARGLFPAIEQVCARAGIRLVQLDAVAVGIGPGSFTGLRVGLTAAKTFAHVLGCRLVALDSLAIVAAAIGTGEVLAVADAQAANWYVARYRLASDGTCERLTGPEIVGRAVVLSRDEPATTLTGPGLERTPADALQATRLRVSDAGLWFPSAAAMAPLAEQAMLAGQFADPLTLEPLYIRPSAAEEKREAG